MQMTDKKGQCDSRPLGRRGAGRRLSHAKALIEMMRARSSNDNFDELAPFIKLVAVACEVKLASESDANKPIKCTAGRKRGD